MPPGERPWLRLAPARMETVRVTGRDPESAPYVFGHSEVELRRLAFQAEQRLIEDVTASASFVVAASEITAWSRT